VTISEKSLTSEEREQLLTGIESALNEIADDNKKYQINIQKIWFNPTDFQTDGLFWAGRDWISKALKFDISEPEITFDKKLNKYLFKLKSSVGIDEVEYDKHADFYYTNLINALVLFSLNVEELEKLASPVFNPLTELESEIDYAFTPVCFETIFRSGIIDISYKNELLSFKKWTDDIPSEIWDWDFIDFNETWIVTRQKANELLDKLGVKSRTYNYDYTTIYDNEGNILKKGKKQS